MKSPIKSLPVLSVDLVAAALKGKGCLSLLDRGALVRIEEHYRMFLAMKSRHPDVPMAPTGLIDEMWHLHMLHPRAYADDCMEILGSILDHDPGFGSVAAERQDLDRHFAQTQFLWEAEFGVPYVDPTLTGEEAPSAIHAVVMCADKKKPTKKTPAKPAKPAKPAPTKKAGGTNHAFRPGV